MLQKALSIHFSVFSSLKNMCYKSAIYSLINIIDFCAYTEPEHFRYQLGIVTGKELFMLIFLYTVKLFLLKLLSETLFNMKQAGEM